MEMSNDYMPELHVAQQRRRDKLRVQQLEDLQGNSFHHNLATNSHSGLNNNSSMVYPTEMLNFTVSHSSTFNNIHPSRFVVPSSSDSCEPVALQSCHNWIPSYDESHVDNERRNFLVPQFSVHHHNSAPITDEISATHHYLNSGHHNWESSGNELALLPSFVSQPNDPRALPHGLSLSLSSNQIREMQCLDEHESRDLKPLESGSVSSVVKLDCGNNNNSSQDVVGRSIHMYRNVGPLGPFTGYSTILKSSKYLKPAQQLLEEFFTAAGLRSSRGCEEVESMPSSSSADQSVVLASKFRGSDDLSSGIRACELYRPDCHEKKSKLLHMQEEVCKRHKQYHQQMEMVILAFESVPGLSNATPYISRSLKTISRHFRSLKSAIADQLKLLKRALGEDLPSPASYMKGDNSSLRLEHSLAIAKSGMGTSGHQNHIWRPQRGLPERAVSILRAWLFDHFLHPYPTDTDKQMLAGQTGLSRNQVSNWFINARVRLWKPMVEEIHMLETKSVGCSEPNLNNRQGAENQSGCKQAINAMCDAKPLDCLPSSSYIEGSRGEINTTQFFQKCSRIESHQIPSNMEGSFMSCLPYQRQGLELGGMGAVSLTLGLRHGSETTQQLQDQFQQQGMQHFGGHVMHNFSG